MSTHTRGDIRVYTYKDGLLSKVAHDLQLTLQRFEITLDGDSLRGRFWPESLRVDGPMVRGRLEPNGLKARDQRDIHKNITHKILHTGRHPTAQFEGSRDGATVQGQLTLAGRTAPLTFQLTEADGVAKGRFTLVPTRWGIQPFKALMGAIKLQDRLEIEFSISL